MMHDNTECGHPCVRCKTPCVHLDSTCDGIHDCGRHSKEEPPVQVPFKMFCDHAEVRFPDTSPLSVFVVEVSSAKASWKESFRTEAEVEAFWRGVAAASSFFGCFPSTPGTRSESRPEEPAKPPRTRAEVMAAGCPKCGSKNLLDASQSFDCNACGHSW